MNQDQEITQLKKRVYDLEQTIENILPLGNELDRRMKVLEDSLQPAPSQDARPIQP